MEKTIDLDCPPGNPRPGDLIDWILEGTGITAEEPVAKLFGNWTWDFSNIEDEHWKRVNEVIAGRIKELYSKGVIRYGSW